MEQILERLRAFGEFEVWFRTGGLSLAFLFLLTTCSCIFKKKTKVDTVMDGKTLFLHINPSLAAYQMI
jgi:hypothetical protein